MLIKHRLCAMAMSFMIMTNPVFGYDSKLLPTFMDDCVTKATKDLLSAGSIPGQTTQQRKVELWKLFLNYADPYWLGARAYGGNNWKSFSSGKKNIGYELFFEYVYEEGLESLDGSRDLTKTTFKTRMADHPDSLAKRPNIFHVVVALKFSDGSTKAAGLLISDQCKLIDIEQSAWISSLLDAEMVDQIARQRKVK